MMKNKLASLILIACSFLWLGSCKQNNLHEKFQEERNHIDDLSQQIVSLKVRPLVGRPSLHIIDHFLVVGERLELTDYAFHLYDLNTFKYYTSFAIRGPKDGEVIRPTNISIQGRNLWVWDDRKHQLAQFPLDSILNNTEYKAHNILQINQEKYLPSFIAINDSLVLGKSVHHQKNKNYRHLSRMNLKTGQLENFGYEHPRLRGIPSNQSELALSQSHQIYVNAYHYYDLITICELNGKLRYNIYGSKKINIPNFKKNKRYFGKVSIIHDRIIAEYNGKPSYLRQKDGSLAPSRISQFLVFDLEGNYLKTIETKAKILSSVIDEVHQRIICYFEDRSNPYGYIPLKLESVRGVAVP